MKENRSRVETTRLILVALLVLLSIHPGQAQEEDAPEDDGSSTPSQFGGPNSVPGHGLVAALAVIAANQKGPGPTAPSSTDDRDDREPRFPADRAQSC